MSDHNPGSELDLDAIEARARHWDHLIRDDPDTTLALVAEVRRLRAQVADQAHRLDMAREFSFRVAEERLGIEPPE